MTSFIHCVCWRLHAQINGSQLEHAADTAREELVWYASSGSVLFLLLQKYFIQVSVCVRDKG